MRSGVLKFARAKEWGYLEGLRFDLLILQLPTEQYNIGFTAPTCDYFNHYNFKMFVCFSSFLDTLWLLFGLEDF